MTNRTLVVASEDAREISRRMALVVPGAADVPVEVRLGVAQIALLHGLDPFMGEIMAIRTKRGYVPYVGIEGTRRASRQQIDYQRVLLPLNDYWADEYFHMTEDELRKANEMHPKDIVWFCAIYVEGKERPFVELGVCGPGFKTVSSAPQWKIAKKRAEAAALKAACDLPFDVGSNGAEETDNVSGEPDKAIEGEVRELATINTEESFYTDVLREIPYYSHRKHIENTMAKMGLVYRDAWQEELFEKLDEYASKGADEEAGAESQPGQVTVTHYDGKVHSSGDPGQVMVVDSGDISERLVAEYDALAQQQALLDPEQLPFHGDRGGSPQSS